MDPDDVPRSPTHRRDATLDSTDAPDGPKDHEDTSGPLDGTIRASDVLPPNEFVVHKNGQVRQAGAVALDGETVKRQKTVTERSLYAFTSGVLGRRYLHPPFHVPMCRWLQKRPPYRKLALWPREHAKTSIVSHGLPCHIIIQPESRNIYFPATKRPDGTVISRPGTDIRITLTCETSDRAEKHLRVVESIFETNQLFRAFWPHVTWANPKAQAKKWNQQEMIVPRRTEYPEPTLQAIGVGGAITGARVDCMICDDLVTLEAANSPAVMQSAIDWHIASRALYEADWTLEFYVGTKWAVHDLYAYMIENDPSVESMVREVIENGEPIYPTKFSLEPEPGKHHIGQLKREFGVLFPLLYQNRATDPELTDFSPDDMRYYRTDPEGILTLASADERDIILDDHVQNPRKRTTPKHGTTHADYKGLTLTDDTYDTMRARHSYLNFKY